MAEGQTKMVKRLPFGSGQNVAMIENDERRGDKPDQLEIIVPVSGAF